MGIYRSMLELYGTRHGLEVVNTTVVLISLNECFVILLESVVIWWNLGILKRGCWHDCCRSEQFLRLEPFGT